MKPFLEGRDTIRLNNGIGSVDIECPRITPLKDRSRVARKPMKAAGVGSYMHMYGVVAKFRVAL